MKLEALEQLTKLVAAHGVYALTVFFLFYQQRRTFRDFQTASPADKPFLRKVYWSAVVATYLLAAISTGAWGYATFRRPAYVWVGGAIDKMKNAIAQPASPADPPSVVQSISMQGGSLQEFFHRLEHCDPKTSLCQFRWVLKTPSDAGSLVFSFHHTYYIAKRRPSAADPIGSATGPIAENNTIDGRFTIGGSVLQQFAGRELSLLYVANEDLKQLGKLYLKGLNDELEELPWESVPRRKDAAVRPTGSWRLAWDRLWTVWAAEARSGLGQRFGPRGEYEVDFGRSLRVWLGGAAVERQLMAVEMLVDAKGRAFKFISDSLNARTSAEVNRSVLTSNLVRAAEAIEAGGTALPSDLVLTLAVASSEQGNYAVAASLFDKAGGAAIEKNEQRFYRALAYRETKRYREAIANLEAFVQHETSPYSKAVALTSIGISYRRNNDPDRAVGYYRRAIQADPKYAGAYNALAYLHAIDQKRQDFSEALALVDTALAIRPNEPNYVDTKGWVLFRMGKYDQAKPLLEQAFAELPEHPDVRSHVEAVRRATRK